MAEPKVLQPFEILASSARTVETASEGFNIAGMQGLLIFLDVTAETGTPKLTVTIEMKMPKGTTYEQICSFAELSLAGAAQYVMMAAPGLLAAGVNGTNAEGLQCYVPPEFRVVVEVADTDSATYSLGGVALRG